MTREEMVGILSIHCDNETCEHCPIYGYADEERFECTFGKLSVSQLTTLIERLHGERRAEDSGATPNEEVAPATETSLKDAIHPHHYKLPGGMQVIDVEVAMFGREAVMHHCLCTAAEYILRSQQKNGTEDIKKAHWWLCKYIELEGSKDE